MGGKFLNREYLKGHAGDYGKYHPEACVERRCSVLNSPAGHEEGWHAGPN